MHWGIIWWVSDAAICTHSQKNSFRLIIASNGGSSNREGDRKKFVGFIGGYFYDRSQLWSTGNQSDCDLHRLTGIFTTVVSTQCMPRILESACNQLEVDSRRAHSKSRINSTFGGPFISIHFLIVVYSKIYVRFMVTAENCDNYGVFNCYATDSKPLLHSFLVLYHSASSLWKCTKELMLNGAHMEEIS